MSKERTPLEVGSILNCIIKGAERNSTTSSKQYHHEDLIIQFATSLYIYSGPLAYNVVHSNLPKALPSLRTIQRRVHNNYKAIKEGVFRFDELSEHLEEYKSPRFISIGEHATRVIARVDYDPETDKLVGFVMPIQENGLPITNCFSASS